MVKDSICIHEKLEIENNSSDFDSLIWDFCRNTIDDPINISEDIHIVNSDFPISIKLVYDIGYWYGFVTNRTNHKLLRLEFGKSLSNIPNITDLGTLGVLNVPKNPEFVKEDGTWIGLLVNAGNSRLIRLNFGNSLTNTPTSENLGSFNSLSDPRGLSVKKDNDSWIAVVSNQASNKISIINMGSNLLNPAGSFTILEFSDTRILNPFGNSIVQDQQGRWHAFLTSNGNNSLVKLTFGTELFSIPSFQSSWTIPSAIEVKAGFEGLEYYAFVLSRFNGLFKLSFGDNIDSSPTIDNLGFLGGAISDSRGMDLAYNGISWEGKIVSRNGNLHTIKFSNHCEFTESNHSFSLVPEGVMYNSPGMYIISLSAFSYDMHFSSSIDTLIIKPASAPTLSFSTDNACIDNENTFYGASSDDAAITSWFWDFGDGTGVATGQNANYQFSQTGNYDIRLAIETAEGCSNSITKSIPVFEPPIANFTFPTTSTCSNSPVSLSNSTLFQGPDSLLTYLWNLNEEMSTDMRDAIHTFTSGGSKNITLTASIPGCASSVSKQMDIIPGPATSFSFEGSCDYDLFKFSNQTSGESITGYQWNFGDGYTSSVASPTHRFGIPNNYIVSLTATSTFGCQTTLNQVVPVYSTPQLNFTNDLACAGSEITFYDQSSAVGANIIDRHWHLSNTEHNYYKNASGAEPAFLTDKAGTYSMELIGMTNYGCADTLTREVNIKPSPKADFNYGQTCYGDSTRFQQAVELPEGSQLLSVNWLMDGKIQPGFESKYKFPTDGDKTIEMFVRADNLCTSHIQKQIRILPLPTAVINLSSQCTNQPVHVSPIVDADSSDPVQQYLWSIDGKIISTQQNFNYTFNAASSYVLALSMNTANNCQFSTSETISIHPKPVSEFEIFPSMGASPLNIQFTDRSTGAGKVTYHFSLQNDEISADRNPVYIYNQLGYDYPYQVAENQYGCRDTSYATIQVVHPVYDLAISEVGSEITDQKIGLYVTLENLGTIIINNPVIKINLDKNISLQQQLSGKLLPGENRKFEIDFEVLQRNSSIQYICFSLENAWAGYSDANSENNAKCLSLENAYIVMEPFPNPSASHVSIPVILPQPGNCEISIFDNSGNLILGKKFNNLQTGLNTIRLDLSLLTKGVYLTHIRHQDFSATKKIILN